MLLRFLTMQRMGNRASLAPDILPARFLSAYLCLLCWNEAGNREREPLRHEAMKHLEKRFERHDWLGKMLGKT